jgi:glycosyltransferase involved in cell wall biosynthesis
LVIVDDGSTDETPELIKSYVDKRIKYVRQCKNKGLPHALNTGFSNATGSYLTWTSDDNQYLPKAIRKMIECLESHPEADFVYADYWAHYLDSGKREFRSMPDTLSLDKSNEVGPCFLYTRRVREKIGEYAPHYELVEDYEYWDRICRVFKTRHLREPLYIYGEHRRSLKGTKNYSILLLESVLKYRRGYLSTRAYAQVILDSCLMNLRSKRRRESFRIILRDLLRIHRVSLYLRALLPRFDVGPLGWRGLKKASIHAYCALEAVAFDIKRPATICSLKRWDGKNVLCIVPFMVTGGSERVLLTLSRALAPEGYRFHLITTEGADHRWEAEFRSSFDNVVVPASRVLRKRLFMKYLSDLLYRLKIDVVLISNSTLGYQCLPEMRSSFGHIPAVDVLHAEASGGATPGFLWATQYLDRRVCISRCLRDYMRDQYRRSEVSEVYTRRLAVIHNGIDTVQFSREGCQSGSFRSRFSLRRDKKIVAFIGRFSLEKQPALAVEIAKDLLSKFPSDPPLFVMAGDGPEIGNVQTAIDRSGLGPHFLLPGAVDNVVELLADTSVLLIVSRTEGIPIVLIEAMAMKVPVISLNVGAISEVLKNDWNGCLIDPMEPVIDRFSEKILELLSGQVDSKDLLEKARETVVSEYSLEVMRSRYRQLFDELARNGGRVA